MSIKNSPRVLLLCLLASCGTLTSEQDPQAVEGVFSKSATPSGLLVDADPVAARDAMFSPVEKRVEPFPWSDLTVDPAPLAARGLESLKGSSSTATWLSNEVVDATPLDVRATR